MRNRSFNFMGENVAAICVREVKVVKSPDGESTFEFGESFWRVYWGLADKEAKISAPLRDPDPEASGSGPHQSTTKVT